MENPMTWGSVEKCIAKCCGGRVTAEIVISNLQQDNLLPDKIDLLTLKKNLDQGIKDHQKALADRMCGLSLPARLARLIK